MFDGLSLHGDVQQGCHHKAFYDRYQFFLDGNIFEGLALLGDVPQGCHDKVFSVRYQFFQSLMDYDCLVKFHTVAMIKVSVSTTHLSGLKYV